MRKKINPLYYFIPVLHLCLIALFLFLQFKPVSMSNDYKNNGTTVITENQAPNSRASSLSENKEEKLRKKELKAQVKLEKKLARQHAKELAAAKKAREKDEAKAAKVARASASKKGLASKKSKFKKKVGSMLVYSSKKSTISNQSVKISSATVEQGGFSFHFESKNDVIFIQEGVEDQRLSLKRVSFDEKSITMELSNDKSVSFIQRGDDLLVRAKGNTKGVIQIALGKRDKAEFLSELNPSQILANYKREQYLLLQQNSKAGYLKVYPAATEKISAEVIMLEKNSSQEKAFTSTLRNTNGFASLLDQWKNSAWKGWTNGRLNQSNGLWKLASGSVGVTPDLISVFLAEGYNRGTPEEAIAQISAEGFFKYDKEGYTYSNVKINDKVLNFDTALIYGDLRFQYDKETREVKEILSSFSGETSKLKYSIFSDPRLADKIAFWGSQSQQNKFFELINNVSAKKLTVNESAEFILTGIKTAKLYPREKQQIKSSITKVVSHLIANLSWNNGIAYVKDGSLLDFEAGWKAALALQEASRFAGGDWKVIASSLLAGVSPEISSTGMIPVKSGFLAASKVVRWVSPESLYLWQIDQPYLPRVERFNIAKAAGMVVYHRAKSLSIDSGTDSEIALSFNHWVNSAERYKALGANNSFLIKKLPKFKKVQIYGLNWNAAENFEIYRSGYFYYENEGLALVMLKHKDKNEKFRIQW